MPDPIFQFRSSNPFGLTDVGSLAAPTFDVGYQSKPTFVDIDGDGDLDAFIGNRDGNTLFYRNITSLALWSRRGVAGDCFENKGSIR